MIPTLHRITALLLLALLTAGCQTISEKKSDMRLRETLYSYESTVRWGLLEHTYQFLKPENFQQASPPADLDAIRVTGYDVLLPPAYVTETVVTQSVKISYVFKDRPSEHTLTDHQQWEYDEEGKVWYRTTPMPEFK